MVAEYEPDLYLRASLSGDPDNLRTEELFMNVFTVVCERNSAHTDTHLCGHKKRLTQRQGVLRFN